MNPIDPYSDLRIDIRRTYKEIDSEEYALNSMVNQKIDEIKNNTGLIKSAVNERANELINRITSRKNFLIEEADKIQNNLIGQCKSCVCEKNYTKPVDCDTLPKPELDLLKAKQIEMNNLFKSSHNKLNQMNSSVGFRVDKANEFNLGEIIYTNTSGFFNNAEQHFKANRFLKSIEYLNRVIEISSDHAEAYFLKGRCFAKLSRMDEAMDCFDKAIQYNHAGALNTKAFLMPNKAMSKLLFERALELNKSPATARDFCAKGDTLHGLEKYQDSLAFYDKAIQLNPDYGEAHSAKGWSLHKMGKFQEAIECFNKAIDINPEDSANFSFKGLSFHSMGKFQEAVDRYNKAIELNPNDAVLYINKGNSLYTMDKFAEAVICYDTSIQLNPKNAVIYKNKGVALDKMGRYQEALHAFDIAIELDPSFAQAYRNKGLSLLNTGRFQEAIYQFNRAIELNPNYATAINDREIALSYLDGNQSAAFNV